MKTNICVIGLAPTFTQKVAKALADKLEMYFADINALIEFDILNVHQIVDLCGKDYLQKIENKKVKQVASFENSLLTLNFTLLNNDFNSKAIKEKCVVVFLKLNQQAYEKKILKEKYSKLSQILNINMFNDRTKICASLADIVFECDEQTVAKIATSLKNEIIEFYTKRGVV